MTDRMPTAEEAEVLALCARGVFTIPASLHRAYSACRNAGWVEPASGGFGCVIDVTTPTGREALARARAAGIVR